MYILYIIIGVSLFLFLFIFAIILISYKNKYSFLYIKLKEADNNMDILLQKKEELMLKIIPFLEEIDHKEELPDLIKLKSKKLDHYELYKELEKNYNELVDIMETYESKLNNKELSHFIDKLNDNENDLRAALKYYNDSATEINHLIHHFPSNLLKLVNHYEDIELYTFKKQDRFELLTEQ